MDLSRSYSEKSKNYNKLQKLGQGQYGVAYLAEDVKDKSKWVLKEVLIPKGMEKELKHLESELNLLMKLNNPFITKYREHFLMNNGDTLCIVMEFADAGDLNGLIKSTRDSEKKFSEDQIWNFTAQLASALKAVFEVPAIHRDLKPANIFLMKKTNQVKLGDFGLAKHLVEDDKFASTQVGTPYYMSPELLNGKKYDCKTDLWSLGCIIYELCTLRRPFPATSLGELIDMIKAGIKIDDKANEFPSKDLKNLVLDLLKLDPAKRMDIDQVLSHKKIAAALKNFDKNNNKSPENRPEKEEVVISPFAGKAVTVKREVSPPGKNNVKPEQKKKEESKTQSSKPKAKNNQTFDTFMDDIDQYKPKNEDIPEESEEIKPDDCGGSMEFSQILALSIKEKIQESKTEMEKKKTKDDLENSKRSLSDLEASISLLDSVFELNSCESQLSQIYKSLPKKKNECIDRRYKESKLYLSTKLKLQNLKI